MPCTSPLDPARPWPLVPAIDEGRDTLKVTSVATTPLSTGQLLVRVHTDQGLMGLGECYVLAPGVVKRFIDDLLAPLVIGRDPTLTARRWDDMFYATTRYGPMGLQTAAIGAVDIALWDIAGKAAGRPIHDLLGGGGDGDDTALPEHRHGLEKDPPRRCSRRSSAVSKGVSVPSRFAWTGTPIGSTVIRRLIFCASGPAGTFCRARLRSASTRTTATPHRPPSARAGALEQMGAAHFEEPVPQHDMPGLRKVVQALDVPVSFGEQQHTRWQFRDLIELADPDILQPDVVLAGGITESVRIYQVARACGKEIMPHCPTAGIASAASLHLYSTLIDAARPHEYSEEFSGDPSTILARPVPRHGGVATLPEGPGLGIELDEAAVDRLSVDA